MSRFPSRFRRLDEILADLPIEDPLLLTELDGYLTGIAVCPEAIEPAQWLPPIWGGLEGEGAPFEDPLDVQLFADMVQARYAEILRDLAREKPQPIYDVDERNGEVLWEEWLGGFDMAMQLRPHAWAAAAAGDDQQIVRSLSHISTLIGIASDETTLTSLEINALCDVADRSLPAHVAMLYRLFWPKAAAPAVLGNDRQGKVGRNDPCPCGSGKKYKRCCGAG